MAKYSVNVTGNGNFYICDVNKPRQLTEWYATIVAAGDFGSGTLTFGVSADGGSTVVAIDTATYSFTDNTAFNIDKLGHGNNTSDDLKFYAIMAGSTSPDVDVTAHDNK